jgi:hypothetical protein
MAQRLTYRRRCSYNTRSNRVKAVKTPGTKINENIDSICEYWNSHSFLF